jgi:hypothetical protein
MTTKKNFREKSKNGKKGVQIIKKEAIFYI